MQASYQLKYAIRQVLCPLSVRAKEQNHIVSAYSQPWRSYHNAVHILQMLSRAKRREVRLDKYQYWRLCVMIIYHDIWYVVGSPPGENEARSAEWAITDVKGIPRQSPEHLHRALSQGINATAKHNLDGVDDEFKLEVATLIDLDLLGLGKSPEGFAADSERVWQEYSSIATRDQFDAGRSAWARSFLDSRDRIYQTTTFARYEQAARNNLRKLAG